MRPTPDTSWDPVGAIERATAIAAGGRERVSAGDRLIKRGPRSSVVWLGQVRNKMQSKGSTVLA